jgi:chorismate mutase / prephenate dehydratase
MTGFKMSEIKEVAYLGPEGTYSHITAQKHFGSNVKLIPMSSIIDVCNFASEDTTRRAFVPVENSSGGPIAETLDILIYNTCNLAIEESVRLGVKLALLGRKNVKIEKVYSHSVPLFHCRNWLRDNYPEVVSISTSSTAVAAKQAAEQKYSAAIASINSASLYNLDVLVHPIQQEIPNQTQFYSLCLTPDVPLRGKIKTSVAAFIKDTPGSLYEFLEPFKIDRVNMSRIISRPIYGRPSEYAFYVDIDGDIHDLSLIKTVNKISNACETCRVISSYPENKVYSL